MENIIGPKILKFKLIQYFVIVRSEDAVGSLEDETQRRRGDSEGSGGGVGQVREDLRFNGK